MYDVEAKLLTYLTTKQDSLNEFIQQETECWANFNILYHVYFHNDLYFCMLKFADFMNNSVNESKCHKNFIDGSDIPKV